MYDPGTGGLVPYTPPNFSHIDIPTGRTIVVPPGQQMVVDGPIRVMGHLTVRGEVVDVSARQVEQFFYDLIGVSKVVTVEQDRLLFYSQHITVQGHLRVRGRMVDR